MQVRLFKRDLNKIKISTIKSAAKKARHQSRAANFQLLFPLTVYAKLKYKQQRKTAAH